MHAHKIRELLVNDLSGIQQGYQEDQCSDHLTQLNARIPDFNNQVKEEQTRLIQDTLDPRVRFGVFVETSSRKVNGAYNLGLLIKENPIKENPNKKIWLSCSIKAQDGSFY